MRPDTRCPAQEAGCITLSDPATITMWLWGDVDDNSVANLGDVFLIVQAFQEFIHIEICCVCHLLVNSGSKRPRFGK